MSLRELNWEHWSEICQLFHDGGPYHIETSPLICSANQWTGFCMKGTSIMKQLNALISTSSQVKRDSDTGVFL